jgi:hypothetical protein
VSASSCPEHKKIEGMKYCIFCVIEHFKEVNDDLRTQLKVQKRLYQSARDFRLNKRMHDKNF